MANIDTQPSQSIAALLADIDGTVVTKQKVVTERAKQALQRMRDLGLIFTITSGRPPRGLRMLVEPLGLKMPMAAFNGGAIVLPDLSLLDEKTVPDYLLPAIIETIQSEGLDVWLYTATDWYIRGDRTPRVKREASNVQFDPTIVTNFDNVLTGIVKIVAVSEDHPRVAACEALLQQEFGTQVTALRSQPHYVDVTHPAANKGSVVERLSRYLKIPTSKIATIGDQSNDVMMFKPSGLSIAMGNSSKEVQNQAMVVTASNADEGFAKAIEDYIIPRAEPPKGAAIKANGQLNRLGQSLWLDNITRDLLTSGTLDHYINELSVTGLTSNPTIFEEAIKSSTAYDAAFRQKGSEGRTAEELFFDIALADITRAADLFRPIYDRTNTVDGWVSLEVSPLLAYDTKSTIAAAKELFARAKRPNLFIKIPGTKEGLSAIEEVIFAGIPVNVTLLFSREQYFAAAEAFLSGLERRMDAGLNPNVASVASVFVSLWDGAVAGKVPENLKNKLGIALAQRTYKGYRNFLTSRRWQRIFNKGAMPQRLLWASTGTKDPLASDVMYIKALAAPFTVNTMPEETLQALAHHGDVSTLMHADGGNCEEVLAQFSAAGIDLHALAGKLQKDAAESFVNSWNELLGVIEAKRQTFEKQDQRDSESFEHTSH